MFLVLALFACGGSAGPVPPAAVQATVHAPPIDKSEVTPGHWYCDMGTVHYSRPDKLDGRCGECGMNLVHKPED